MAAEPRRNRLADMPEIPSCVDAESDRAFEDERETDTRDHVPEIHDCFCGPFRLGFAGNGDRCGWGDIAGQRE